MRGHKNLGMRHGLREHRSLTERQFARFAELVEEDRMSKNNAAYAKFEGFEERLAHCYFLLHERFIANPSLAKFWAEAAIEELQHSSLLRFCRERGFTVDDDLEGKTAEHVEQLLDTVKSIVSDPEVTIDEAFYASLLMESSEIDEVYEKLTRSLAKDHRILYDAIHANLRSHHDRFAEGADEFCAETRFAEAFRALGKSERRALDGRSF